MVETNSITTLGMTTPPPDAVVMIEDTPFANSFPPPSSFPTPGTRGAKMLTMSFTIRIPSAPLTYAAALTHTTD